MNKKKLENRVVLIEYVVEKSFWDKSIKNCKIEYKVVQNSVLSRFFFFSSPSSIEIEQPTIFGNSQQKKRKLVKFIEFNIVHMYFIQKEIELFNGPNINEVTFAYLTKWIKSNFKIFDFQRIRGKRI